MSAIEMAALLLVYAVIAAVCFWEGHAATAIQLFIIAITTLGVIDNFGKDLYRWAKKKTAQLRKGLAPRREGS